MNDTVHTLNNTEGAGVASNEGNNRQVIPVWCHVCRRREHLILNAQTIDAQVSLVCPTCGSDFVERLEQQEGTSAVEQEGNAHGYMFNNVQHVSVGQQTARVQTIRNITPLPAGGQRVLRIAPRNGTGATRMVQLRAPYSVRIEASGPLLGNLSGIFSRGMNSVEGQAGNFVFHNEALERILNQLAENHVVPSVPACPEVVEKLQRIHSRQQLKGCASEGCSICQEDYGDEEFVAIKLPCGHVFHEECIGMWFKEQNTCPVCRFKLPASEEPAATAEAPQPAAAAEDGSETSTSSTATNSDTETPSIASAHIQLRQSSSEATDEANSSVNEDHTSNFVVGNRGNCESANAIDTRDADSNSNSKPHILRRLFNFGKSILCKIVNLGRLTGHHQREETHH